MHYNQFYCALFTHQCAASSNHGQRTPLQEVSARTLGLLGRQPWLADYHRSPLPADIGRCCTVILLRKVC